MIPKKTMPDVPLINTSHGTLKGEGSIQDESFLKLSGIDRWSKIFSDFGQFFEGHMYRKADHLIAVSEFTKNLLKEYNIPDDKIDVDYNGVDIDKYRPVDTDLKERLGTENIILYLGRLSKRKGVQRLLRNAKEILDGREDTEILVVGKGGYRKRLIDIKNDSAVEDSIKFLGFVEDPIKYLNAADVVVVPSIVDPFPLVPLEAKACGSTVVVSDGGGAKEIISDGEDGFVFETEEEMVEKINLAMENNELGEKTGERAREKIIKYFSWEEMAKKTEKVYRRVVENH